MEKAKASCRRPIKPLEFTGRLKACHPPQVDVTECVTRHKKRQMLQCTNTVINSKHAMRIGNGDVTVARRGPGLSDELLVRLEQRRERERETGGDGEAGQLAQINFKKQ